MVNVRGLIDDIAFAQPQSMIQRRRSAKQESLQAEGSKKRKAKVIADGFSERN